MSKKKKEGWVRQRGRRRSYYASPIGSTGQFELGWIWEDEAPRHAPKPWRRIERAEMIRQAVAAKAKRIHPDWGLGDPLGDEFAYPLDYNAKEHTLTKKRGARYSYSGQPMLGMMGYVLMDQSEIKAAELR